MNLSLLPDLIPLLALYGNSKMKKILLALLALSCSYTTLANERIVVAGGSLTELVYALGAGKQVVAVDETTTWPPESAKLPHIGYWKQLSVEGILSLNPSLFITWQDAGPQVIFDQLKTQQIEVLTLPRIPATVEQMYNNIGTLAQALNLKPEGEKLVTQLRERLANVTQKNTARGQTVNVLFILSAGSSAPQIAGKGSVADIILTLAGANNLASHPQYKSYSAEAIIAANPEVIIVTSQMAENGIDKLNLVPGITHTSAWKNKRIVTIDQALILGMGPRIADAVEQLNHAFWPDAHEQE